MNILNSHIYSMTRSTGVERSQQPVVCQHQHWSVVDGISSLLPNKSLFQMSDMVKNVNESNDEVNKEHTASDILSVPNCQVDNMSSSEKEHDLTLTEHKLPLADILNKEIKHSGTQSRFRIVKIESKGLFKRGRWTCRDFADPPEAKASDLAETQSTGSSSSTEPVFYVQGTGPTGSQLIFYSEGHPVLESDALPCASKLLIDEIAGSISTTEADSGLGLVSVCQPTADNSNDRVSADSGLKSIDVANSDAGSEGTVGTGIGDRHHDFDRMLWPVGQEEMNTPSLLSLVVDDTNESTMASGSMSEIDSKIEQAMDLVKAHLMLAVRAEIEELKEQIKQLMVKNHQLEYENNILRAAADPDLIASLDSVAADSEFDNGS